VSKGKTGSAAASKHVPQSIARKAVEERVAILSDNAAADERFKGKSILIQSVRSAMCTPLMGTDQQVLGILYVDNLTATHSFADEDLEFLIAFGSLAAVGIENSRRSERLRREALVLSNFQRYFAPNLAAQIAQQEGEADRAMKCGLDQLDALEKMNKKWKAEGRPELGIGIGINFGEVFAGNIGSDRRLEYTVIGDAVNTASRLCSIAGPNEILISEAFYGQLKKPPKVETLDPIELKGRSKKVPVYRMKR